jgi:cell division protein ZapA
MKESKKTIRLSVYDELIDVNVSPSDEKKYRNAAKLITERLEAYTRLYEVKKSAHSISLITMLDIAVRLMPDDSENETEAV